MTVTTTPNDARRGAKSAPTGARGHGAFARARCAFAPARGPIALAIFVHATTFACGGALTAGARDGTEPLDAVPSADDAATAPTSADSGTSDAPVEQRGTPDASSYASNLGDFAIDVADVMARYSSPYPVTRALTVFASKLEIHLVDYVGRCADEATDTLRGGTKVVKIVVERRASSAGGAALTPGTYRFGDGLDDAVIERGVIAPSTCELTNTALSIDPLTATKSELVVTTLTETHVAGTFELATSDGRFLRGSFDTDLCTSRPFVSTAVCE